MPLYTWKCEVCEKEIDILRPFAESSEEPKEDDTDYPKEECQHKWTKVMNTFRLTRGPNWTGKKGHW
jgi:predicted nucleic acid-binding Zn ribbon protein